MSNAIVLTAFGSPEVLAWRPVVPPEPAPGEVLIRVRAAAIGPTDLHIRAGDLTAVFPQRPGDVLGFEAAGVVEAVGAGAEARIGEEVAALLPTQGGYGELATTTVWWPKPASVDWDAPTRVVTLVGGPEVAASGAFLSHPDPDRAPDALAVTMPLLASGTLRMKRRRVMPVRDAAEGHRLLESGGTTDKVVLSFP